MNELQRMLSRLMATRGERYIAYRYLDKVRGAFLPESRQIREAERRYREAAQRNTEVHEQVYQKLAEALGPDHPLVKEEDYG